MRSLLTAAAALCLLAASTTPASASGSGAFELYRAGADAVTYDPNMVPVGSRAAVIPFTTGKTTVVLLIVHGLLPNRHYGAHVHTKPCGPDPADAGPHFQNKPDPVTPSVDPAYANPENEVWLDFVTGPHGQAVATAKVRWRFGDRPAGSLVIHRDHTHTEPGQAGVAGPRLACVNADF
ncbi:superoxide dismutase family protein [Actinokineospora iranica]|uniref:Superoxide dismutase, Cu-Zn family n=1 Tax=Actinokineospora iranica TaxID=1271860 RepID=A0A1G6K5E1_9PSEU|nr:superoxide dismutase family protein [Actinokineospora iranica]SDC26220.1 superoxide dismutase, Cu-Zn family [Actinokineospora iranica]